MNFRKIEATIIIVIIGVVGAAFALTESAVNQKAKTENLQTQEKTTQQSQVLRLVPGSQVIYKGQEGKSALEILKANHRVETKDFSGVGEFVAAIDGVEPQTTHFWSFYVNGSQAQVGASAYLTKDSDTIEWKLEEIK